jgi:hypothetical protein
LWERVGVRGFGFKFQTALRHCEEKSDEAIQSLLALKLDCFASLAMTQTHARAFRDAISARKMDEIATLRP